MGKFCFSFKVKKPCQHITAWQGSNKTENNLQLENLGILSTVKIPITL